MNTLIKLKAVEVSSFEVSLNIFISQFIYDKQNIYTYNNTLWDWNGFEVDIMPNAYNDPDQLSSLCRLIMTFYVASNILQYPLGTMTMIELRK